MALPSMLDPAVLPGLVEKLPVQENLWLTKITPTRSFPVIGQPISWDILRGNRQMALANTLGAEAHVIGPLGRSLGMAMPINVREKKPFSPMVQGWFRQPGALSQVRAEDEILREIQDLNYRLDLLIEYCLWQAISGSLLVPYGPAEGNQPDVTVNYEFANTHTVYPGTAWNAVTDPVDIVADIQAWKELVEVDGGVEVTQAYLTQPTLEVIFRAFASKPELLSDSMKTQFYTTGQLPGFMGLNWRVVRASYVNKAGQTKKFVDDNKILMGNYTEGRPIELAETPHAEYVDPGFTGRLSKVSDKSFDPAGYWYLLDYNFIPIVTRPEQMLVAPNINATGP